MSKIAIDVVLLPPEKIMDKAIAINQQFPDDPIKLNKHDYLPHISLCMGVLDKKNLPEVKKILDNIGKNFSTLDLTIDKINKKEVCFEIRKTPELQRLHEEIMTKLEHYLTHDATTDTVLSIMPVGVKTLDWINNYENNSSFTNFYPHITLGVSNLEEKELNINFKTSKLVLCHLGNHCTCHKILHSIELT